MQRYDQVVCVRDGCVRTVNNHTRIYTIECVEGSLLQLFDVPGVLFDLQGSVARCTPVDRFAADCKEKLNAHSIVRTNVNWQPNDKLYYACALRNKDYYKEIIK